ncbi:glutathione-dependent formaldehyde-activating GFA [Methylobacterium sp. 4-46]|uniref:GFA family protein n=1 Tax=unclassified Methylobacterium TaxID=2615210 RepID=UPI000152CA82|nr:MULTISPECIES: GFA family protein [Methylobacterium]ACA16810.1 glutathione-dependent formaldehyde-activating GFA [Methylobacterium sp. 4-46]WFT82504.1 GFA family protein [Methylobacterium nodulans]
MLTGGCLCGRVRYAADAPAFHETLCHCASCRRAVGAAPVAWFSVARAALRFTGEAPSRYASSPGVVRGFCATCGTSLTYEAEAHAEEIDVTIASLDDPDAAPPRDHTQAAGRPRWTVLADGLPAYPGRRPGR